MNLSFMKLTAKYILLAEFLDEVPDVQKGYCGGREIPPSFPSEYLWLV